MKKINYKFNKALITGASSGLGQEYARQLAETGTDLILVARRRERLEALAADLNARYRVGTEVFPADLSVDEDLNSVARKIAQTPELDLMINNAGFGGHGQFHLDEKVRLTR